MYLRLLGISAAVLFCSSCANRRSHFDSCPPDKSGHVVYRVVSGNVRIIMYEPGIGEIVDVTGTKGLPIGGVLSLGEPVFPAAECGTACSHTRKVATLDVSDLAGYVQATCLHEYPGCNVQVAGPALKMTGDTCPDDFNVCIQQSGDKPTPVCFHLPSDGTDLDLQALFPTIIP